MFLGGAPLAMAYKAVNTLDSMVGYKKHFYQDFGWHAAIVDEAFIAVSEFAGNPGGYQIFWSARTQVGLRDYQ
jgi:hypothetical protein